MPIGRISIIHKGLAQSWLSGFFSGLTIGAALTICILHGLKNRRV
jgi:hypothetical protein